MLLVFLTAIRVLIFRNRFPRNPVQVFRRSRATPRTFSCSSLVAFAMMSASDGRQADFEKRPLPARIPFFAIDFRSFLAELANYGRRLRRVEEQGVSALLDESHPLGGPVGEARDRFVRNLPGHLGNLRKTRRYVHVDRCMPVDLLNSGRLHFIGALSDGVCVGELEVVAGVDLAPA
jgi:hypothetical protein